MFPALALLFWLILYPHPHIIRPLLFSEPFHKLPLPLQLPAVPRLSLCSQSPTLLCPPAPVSHSFWSHLHLLSLSSFSTGAILTCFAFSFWICICTRLSGLRLSWTWTGLAFDGKDSVFPLWIVDFPGLGSRWSHSQGQFVGLLECDPDFPLVCLETCIIPPAALQPPSQ